MSSTASSRCSVAVDATSQASDLPHQDAQQTPIAVDQRCGVMQVTDTLAAGGLERVAVNLANLLPREKYRSFLCTTRRDGPLSDLISGDVGRLCLGRTSRYDLAAVGRLAAFARQHEIKILHAHGTAIFIASVATMLPPFPKLVWHDHFGRYAVEERPAWLYKHFVRRAAGIVAVNEPLVRWSRQRLGARAERITYLPNFVCSPTQPSTAPQLPGVAGKRIVCVANLRKEKDHPTLLAAMSRVLKRVPDAHLLLLGATVDATYQAAVEDLIGERNLSAHVTLLGSRRDVDAILRTADVGVLSSASEGLPLALLEYGTAGLPSIATRVGQCPEVLDEGRVGMLVPPGDQEQLADALIKLLESAADRRTLGDAFRQRVEQAYSARAAIEQVDQVYRRILGTEAR